MGEKCPTWDQTCAISKYKNHFAVSQLCQIEKQTQEVHEKPHYEKNDPNLLLVNETSIKNTKDWEIKLKIEKGYITLKTLELMFC